MFAVRTILTLLVASWVVVAPSRAATGRPQSRSMPRVALVRSTTAAPLEQATEAITDALGHQRPRCEVLSYLLPEESDLVDDVFAQIRQARPDLLVTLGSQATAAALAEDPSAPLLFSMVLHPVQEGFVRPGVAGVALDVPFDQRFALVRRLLPAAHSVGVVYDPRETGSVVEEARRSAQRAGFRFESEQVENASDALRAVDRIVRRVDVLWALADSSVFTPITTGPIQLAALQRHVPVIGLSASHARTGALAAFTLDYADVGRQTAAAARRLLAGESPERVAVSGPRKVGVVINARTARRLGLRLDPAVTREATEVVR